MREISVLQIADENWQEQYDIPSNIRWRFVKPEDMASLVPTDIEMLSGGIDDRARLAKIYDLILVDTLEHFEYITVLDSLIQPYRLFYHERCQITTKDLETFLFRKKAVKSQFESPEQILYRFSRALFPQQSGSKLKVNHLAVHSLRRLLSPLYYQRVSCRAFSNARMDL